MGLPKADNTHLQLAAKSPLYLVCIMQVLTLFQNVLSDKDVRVCKQDVHQLIDAVHSLLPRLRLHVCVQVGVVVIKRSGDIEPDLDDDVLS